MKGKQFTVYNWKEVEMELSKLSGLSRSEVWEIWCVFLEGCYDTPLFFYIDVLEDIHSEEIENIFSKEYSIKIFNAIEELRKRIGTNYICIDYDH